MQRTTQQNVKETLCLTLSPSSAWTLTQPQLGCDILAKCLLDPARWEQICAFVLGQNRVIVWFICYKVGNSYVPRDSLEKLEV